MKIVNSTVLYSIVATLLLVSKPGHAREGLTASLNNAPPAVARAWPSTFAYLGPDRWGTAFVIGRRVVGPEVEIYFLTANHVVDATCRRGVLCPATVLVKNMRAWSEAPYTRIVPTELPAFERIHLVDRIKTADLAIVATRVPAAQAAGVMILPLTRTCGLSQGEPIFSVGFSATMDRTLPHGLILDPGVATKRWAQGIYVGDFLKTATDAVAMVGTTVDGFTGHSGAALINARGEVISVFNQAVAKIGHAYDGNETVGHLDWHSLGASCEIVRSLAPYQYR